MITNIFDPSMDHEPITVKVNPGQIIIGKTCFADLQHVDGLTLSPRQAAKLILVLTEAIELELSYSEQYRKSMGCGDEFL